MSGMKSRVGYTDLVVSIRFSLPEGGLRIDIRFSVLFPHPPAPPMVVLRKPKPGATATGTSMVNRVCAASAPSS